MQLSSVSGGKRQSSGPATQLSCNFPSHTEEIDELASSRAEVIHEPAKSGVWGLADVLKHALSYSM